MKLYTIDRRVIYLFVFLALSVPLLRGWSVTPARMRSAERLFDTIDQLVVEPGQIALVALDYGPNLVAENGSQAEVIVEHLMRRRIPIAVISLYAQAEPYLNSVPENAARRLMKEMPGEQWDYGKDWVNLGYRPGMFLVVQSIAKSQNIVEFLRRDARGNELTDLPVFSKVRTIKDIRLMAEFTGLIGMLDVYLQFFQSDDYRVPLVHGCTSITIPDAYIYLDSGQIVGLLEGIAGAAWYSELLQRAFVNRVRDQSMVINTGLGVAHAVVILLVILGNLGMLLQQRAQPKKGGV